MNSLIKSDLLNITLCTSDFLNLKQKDCRGWQSSGHTDCVESLVHQYADILTVIVCIPGELWTEVYCQVQFLAPYNTDWTPPVSILRRSANWCAEIIGRGTVKDNWLSVAREGNLNERRVGKERRDGPLSTATWWLRIPARACLNKLVSGTFIRELAAHILSEQASEKTAAPFRFVDYSMSEAKQRMCKLIIPVIQKTLLKPLSFHAITEIWTSY